MPKRLSLFIGSFLNQHKTSLLLILFIVIIAALEISFAPYVLKVIIDKASLSVENASVLLSILLLPACIYVLLTIVHNLNMRAYNYVCLKLLPRLRTEISVAMFNHLSQHSLSFFQQNFSGDLAHRISSMTEGIESIIKIVNENILGNLFTIVIAAILLSTVHFFFAITLMIWVLLYVGNGFRFAKKTVQYAHAFAEMNSKLSGRLVDSISNIVSAKIFSNIAYETRQIDNAVSEVGQKDAALQKQMLKTHFYQNVLYTLLIIFLLAGLIHGRIHNWVTVGDFAFILGLSITIANMVNGLTQAMPTLSREIGKCQQALNIIVIPHEIEDIKGAKQLEHVQGSIQFNHVTFGYDKTKLFTDLNLSIPAKQKVGLVGFSGGGKTSFINLILRLYDIQSGEICIDQQDIKKVTRDSLIKNIALIPQHPELFHRSIMDNIRYGNVDASDEDVFSAAKLADCHDFIMELNEGYQSLIGERGIKLSGGQRQRIAIARAVLKNAPILILDEATSALDSVTEKQIQRALEKVMEHKTVIVIAHRISTILQMDRILFLKAGSIVEDGTPAQLQAKNGYFAKFLALQAEGFLPF